MPCRCCGVAVQLLSYILLVINYVRMCAAMLLASNVHYNATRLASKRRLVLLRSGKRQQDDQTSTTIMTTTARTSPPTLAHRVPPESTRAAGQHTRFFWSAHKSPLA